MVKRVPCEICGKMLLGKQYVKMHKKITHKELIEGSQV